MKKIFLFLLLSAMFAPISNSQTLIQQIKKAYNALDSVAYIEDVILSYRGDLVIKAKGFEDNVDSSITRDWLDSIPRQKQVIDSLYENLTLRSKALIEEEMNRFSDVVRTTTPVYLLNLIPKDDQTLQVDTGRLTFNLFYFDKEYMGNLYVYCKDGEYAYDDTRYKTFSRKLTRNAPKVFRKIMQKHPKYLLYCYELDKMNTILYVINNDIYIYRIIQNQEYKLNDYIKKFGITNRTVRKDRGWLWRYE